MTLADALQTPAVALLLRLEDDDSDLAVVGGDLRIKPGPNLTPEDRAAIGEHREALIVLVRHCLALAADREVA